MMFTHLIYSFKLITSIPLHYSISITWCILLSTKIQALYSLPFIKGCLVISGVIGSLIETSSLYYELPITSINFYDSDSLDIHYWIYSQGSAHDWTQPGMAAFRSYVGASPIFIQHLPLPISPPSLNEVPGFSVDFFSEHYFIQIEAKALIYPLLRGLGTLFMGYVVMTTLPSTVSPIISSFF